MQPNISVKVHDAPEIFQPQRHEEQRLHAPLGSAASLFLRLRPETGNPKAKPPKRFKRLEHPGFCEAGVFLNRVSGFGVSGLGPKSRGLGFGCFGLRCVE